MRRHVNWTVWVLGLGLGLSVAAHADGERQWLPAKLLPLYVQECAACHLAYPPALLPAPSWQRIMAGLSRHYGADASLEPEQVQAIGQWLQTQAGGYKKVRGAPPQDRITRSDWFLREHREVPGSVWHLPSVRSPAQCAACHSQAEQGRYGERSLRRPAGMGAQERW